METQNLGSKNSIISMTAYHIYDGWVAYQIAKT